MKSSEELALEMHSPGAVLPYPWKGYQSLSDHLKAIQLDAYKAGLAHAAALIHLPKATPDSVRLRWEQQILAVRDNLKPEDMK